MRGKEPSTTVYLVRHGETDFPNDRIYCDDREHPALNQRGRLQAKAAAVAFQDQPIDALYTSPVLRTRQTAEQIADVTGLTPIPAPELVERRFGDWEGLTFDEVEQRFPSEYAAWKRDKAHYTPRGGETIASVEQRVASYLRQIVESHPQGRIVVVTHVGPIRVAVVNAFRIPLDQYRQIRIDYASITRIDYGVSLNNLFFLNRVGYRDKL